MSRLRKEKVTVLDAVTDAGTYSAAIRVSDWSNITFSHATIAASDQVVMVQGAIGSDPPTFSSASAVGNAWGYIETYNLNNTTSAIAGNVGAILSGAGVNQYSVNTKGLDWVSFYVETGTAGAVTTELVAFSNE